MGGSKLPARELGQVNTIAAAFSLMVFFLAVYLLASGMWTAYQVLSLDHALYRASWSIDRAALDEAGAAGDADSYLAHAIASDWTQIDEGCLEVSGARLTVSDERSSHELAGAGDRDLRIERATQTRTYARLTAHVRYTVKSILPAPWVGDVVLDRDVDKVQQISSRFEVS